MLPSFVCDMGFSHSCLPWAFAFGLLLQYSNSFTQDITVNTQYTWVHKPSDLPFVMIWMKIKIWLDMRQCIKNLFVRSSTGSFSKKANPTQNKTQTAPPPPTRKPPHKTKQIILFIISYYQLSVHLVSLWASREDSFRSWIWVTAIYCTLRSKLKRKAEK